VVHLITFSVSFSLLTGAELTLENKTKYQTIWHSALNSAVAGESKTIFQRRASRHLSMFIGTIWTECSAPGSNLRICRHRQ
jgi:hypothetical protein